MFVRHLRPLSHATSIRSRVAVRVELEVLLRFYHNDTDRLGRDAECLCDHLLLQLLLLDQLHDDPVAQHVQFLSKTPSGDTFQRHLFAHRLDGCRDSFPGDRLIVLRPLRHSPLLEYGLDGLDPYRVATCGQHRDDVTDQQHP